MNRIEKLIAELCPDGVEWKKLGEVCKVLRGERLTKKELSSEFQYPVFHGSLIPLGYYYKYNREANKTMIINTGSIGEVVWSSVPFWSSDGTFTIETQNNIIDKFLYYYLKIKESYLKSQKREGGVPTIDRNVIENLPIPLPPLPIQEEIVAILDKFDALVNDLSQGLPAEIEARKKQYEYYRNKLLTPVEHNGHWYLNGVEVEWKTLGEITIWDKKFNNISKDLQKNVISFKHVLAEKLKSFESVNGDIMLLSTGQFIAFTTYELAKEYINEGEVITLPSGGTANIKYYKGKFVDSGNLLAISADTKKYNLKFIWHYLKNINSYIQSFYRGSGVQHPDMRQILNIPIPIPPLPVQERIVAILDKFDALVNDISQGLPAEIEARRKQYEYYRNKLLTFNKK